MLLGVFLLILGILLLIDLKSDIGGFASPSVLNFIIYFIVGLVSFSFLVTIKADIELNTFAIFLFGIICFWIGQRISKYLVKGKDYYIIDRSVIDILYFRKMIIVASIFFWIIFILKIIDTSNILGYLGYSFKSKNFLFYIRHRQTLGYNGQTNTLLSIIYDVVRGGSYSILIVSIKGILTKNIRMKSSQFILVVISQIPVLGIEFLTAGRDGFIRYFFIALLAMLCYMEKVNTNKIKSSRKQVKIGITVAIVLGFVFIFAGNYTGKSVDHSFANILVRYLGGGLLAFNTIINSTGFSFSTGVYRSFYGLYTFIDRIIPLNIDFSTRSDVFSDIGGGISTNVYTGFFDYYMDFGFLGVLVVELTFGIFIGLLFYKTFTKNYDIWIAIYAYYGYMIIRQITEAYYIKMFFTEMDIVALIGLLVFYKIFNRCWIKELE